MEVKNIKIKKAGVDVAALKKTFEIMEKNGVKNPGDMLPKNTWEEAAFELHNTNSSFANAVRRVLIEEIPVLALGFEQNKLFSDDEFILYDQVMKCINMIPINQDLTQDYHVSLDVRNDTDEIITVRAADLLVHKRGKANDAKKSVDDNRGGNLISELIPDSCITICALRPNKRLVISDIDIVEGYGKDDAAKFALLTNVKFEILDAVEPFNQFTGKGVRSIEYDPKNFRISFCTSTNTTVKAVLAKLKTALVSKYERAQALLQEYIDSKQTNYSSDFLEVLVGENNMYEYKFFSEYIQLSYPLAHKCLSINPSISFCVPGIDRYDNRVAIVRCSDVNPNKILVEALKELIADSKKLP
jgi:hypothetical protein